MAVGIEPEAMSEACLSSEVLFRHALEVVDESAVRFIQLAQDLGERKAPFLFYHLRIESIDAAVLDVSRWLLPVADFGQILQRLLLPDSHVRKDLFHRPLSHDARLEQLCIGQASVGLLERRPRRLQSFQKLLLIHDSEGVSFWLILACEHHELAWSPIRHLAVSSRSCKHLGGRRRRVGSQLPARLLKSRRRRG